MTVTRRKFLGWGGVLLATAAGAAGTWTATSRSRTARWLRELARDTTRRVRPAFARPEPARWPRNAITVCWLGHATALIDFYGIRILTDPVFSRRVGIDLGLATLGPKRRIAPALNPAELPPIDVVLLSHAHMDHLDIPSLGRLRPPGMVVTAKETADLLADTPLREAHELGWGDEVVFRNDLGELRIRAFAVNHWGRRWPSDRNRGYNGYLLAREGKAVLFGGDTAMTSAFADVRSFGPFEFALMPIAAYDPWIRAHCTPEQALLMADQAGARRLVPLHHSTFKLSDEPMEEPVARLEHALRHEPERLALRHVGEHAASS
ncbi:MAG TPA: MBL fold metallo-hydrolase [Verrucomicrobiota bacterium]|nr:MBL fold metallo-hydrolase [Verrucomicrobiota bacterium]HNU50521.1 MBL fold metallo-hydrolase [Verrucomicrobiota bacterium]